MPNTDKQSEVVQAMINVIAAAGASLGLALKADNVTYAVYYGDEDLIPKFPAVLVQGGGMQRVIREAAGGNHFLINHTVWITLLHGKVQEQSVTAKEADIKAEAVDAVIMADKSLGGRVVYGVITNIEPGFAEPTNMDAMVSATRLTWEGLGKV